MDKQAILTKIGLPQEKIKELFRQGLEDFVREYDEREASRVQYGSSWSNHWGDRLPDMICVGGFQYTPHELLVHFEKGDEAGARILRRMMTYFMISKSTGIAALGLVAKFKGKSDNLRIYDDRGEVDQREMLDGVKSVDLKVNPLLQMAVYESVKFLYLKPNQRKNHFI